MSGRKEDVNYYMSVGYNKNQNLIEGGEFSTFRARLNLEGKVTNFLRMGANIQYADRDEGAIEADWGQLTNLSPYGDKYNADGTLRRIPTNLQVLLLSRNHFVDIQTVSISLRFSVTQDRFLLQSTRICLLRIVL